MAGADHSNKSPSFITMIKPTLDGASSLVEDAFSLIGTGKDNRPSLQSIISEASFHSALETLRKGNAFEFSGNGFSSELETADQVRATAARRKLKGAYNLKAKVFFGFWSDLAAFEAPDSAESWRTFADKLCNTSLGDCLIKDLLLEYAPDQNFEDLFRHLEKTDPHSIFPTSVYRDSQGQVTWSKDERTIHGVMNTSTMTEIQITEGVLNPNSDVLRRVYKPLGRCVCIVDENVWDSYGKELEEYFSFHKIPLKLRVYRAMEVDKGIRTVERMMADFKALGVSRNEPVLIIGGGVLADTGGLACSLYHRNTPYVMLATSIVSGIDAGPSPRTCCDGFGYKNLFGAYHAPILTITDRTFFKSLQPGWMRHGVAEIIKMAVVKDSRLFDLLEKNGKSLLTSAFGANTNDPKLADEGQKVIAAAMRSYVEVEYGNLFETHQCRPHAYGHTWSPGFEIPAGMLHGHAVSCGMGYGAFLSHREGWINDEELDKVLKLINSFELSLYHPIMDEQAVVVEAQEKMVQKRGGNLAAPIPRGAIGQCGYLNSLTHSELRSTLDEYRERVSDFPRSGLGVEPHCSDVGLEDPSVTGSTAHEELEPVLS